MKADVVWDGSPDHLFELSAISDTDHAKDPDSRRSVTGYTTFLHGMPIVRVGKQQEFVTLSPTKSELVGETNAARELLSHKRLLESIGLKVKLPMKVQGNNRGVLDLMNSQSTGGRTRHIDVRYYFLRELQEQGIIELEWIPGESNCSDLLTKNLGGQAFERHTARFTGVDKYMQLINKETE